MLFVAGCTDAVEDAALTHDELTKVINLQNPFDKPLIKLSFDNNQPEAIFGLKNCRVYKAQAVKGVIVAWDLAIKPDFSLLPQVCDRESMRIEDNYLRVDTGLISLGAGGCCSATGKYRTRDGVGWERYLNDGWQKMDRSKPSNPESIAE